MSGKTFYLTTPIYFASDKLHIGHSYTTVISDAVCRYKRMRGYDVFFLTGTDEHGQKIETYAKNAGVSPQKYVDDIVVSIKELWELMDIKYDRFIRTTDPYHVKSVQKIFKALYDKGEIYKSKYKGSYCRPCESFWTESQLVDGNCPDCGRPVEQAEEEAYFFRLSKYTDKILKLYEEQPDFLQPKSRMNEMIGNFLKPGLDDLCVSRTSFKWGIPVDFDPDHVVYVWVDALTNYITALGYGNDEYNDYDKFWPADVHMMAREIVRFHSIIWPALLMALELPLPKKVYGHGWLLFGGDKMSKSKGNVVDPVVLCSRYGVDAIRYFLLREVPFGQDGSFTNEALIARINSDLANDYGNLVSRTVAMAQKYFGNALPSERQTDSLDDELVAMVKEAKAKIEKEMDEFQLPNALTETFKIISRANKYIDETAPWILAKDDANRPRLASVIYNLLEIIRITTVWLTPVMPNVTLKVFEQIGAGEDIRTWESTETFGKLSQNVSVTKGDTLFPRIDAAKELAELEEMSKKALEKAESLKKKAEKTEGVTSLIEIGDFAKVKLITAQIKECEPVPKADKLLKLMLDDGSETPRQVVSGIHQWYKPEDLIGKKVIVVANLKPAKLRGVESQGMILAADAGEDVRVIFVDEDIPCGSTVR